MFLRLFYFLLMCFPPLDSFKCALALRSKCEYKKNKVGPTEHDIPYLQFLRIILKAK